jgi:hypothetical protein
MNEIESDGKTYILKSQVEAIIKERVSKVAQRATEAESQVNDLSKQIESFKSKQASIDLMNEQISTLQKELKASESRFDRYQSMSKIGINDSELIEAIEWQYNKSMNGKAEKEKIDLNTWLQNQIDNPEDAPIAIRPHIKSISEASKPVQENAPQIANDSLENLASYEQQSIMNQSMPEAIIKPPTTNRGAIPAPEGKDILRRTVNDQDFYNKNADAIKQAWIARYSGK